MASLSDVLSTLQNGVVAINNFGRQMKGTLYNILSRFNIITANVATNTTNIATNTTNIATNTANITILQRLQTMPQGRLTLQTLTPVMTTTQSAKTTLYYTAYQGTEIPIYDGTNMVPTVITGGEISVLTTDATKSPAAIGASKVNDWFVWNDSGTIRLGHGPDWTSDTARSAGTALVMVNGILLNSIALTNGPGASRGTYVGTTRSNAASQLDWIIGGTANGGTAGNLFIWNAYNRVQAYATSVDSVSYTYTTATTREAHASTGNRIFFVSGLAEDAIDAKSSYRVDALGVANSFMVSQFGLDSTTVIAANTQNVLFLRNSATTHTHVSSNCATIPPQLGVHFIARLEIGDGANANSANSQGLDFISVSLRM